LNSFDDTPESDDLIMSQDFLLEPVNIGHSALLLLGLCNALECNIADDNRIEEFKNAIDGLSRGILSMQLENGAFRTYYGDDNFQRGIAFFPGEAMLALVTAYKFNLLNTATREAIMPAMMNAFHFYSRYYNEEDVDTNFNIWQSIAFSALYDCLENQHENQKEVAGYVNTLCQEICQSRAWKYQLSRGQSFYANLETVEIACGLDALAEGIRVAKLEKNMELASQFEKNAANAVQFLGWMQSQVPDSCVVGYGGMGIWRDLCNGTTVGCYWTRHQCLIEITKESKLSLGQHDVFALCYALLIFLIRCTLTFF
jgi:hypothetical protein